MGLRVGQEQKAFLGPQVGQHRPHLTDEEGGWRLPDTMGATLQGYLPCGPENPRVASHGRSQGQGAPGRVTSSRGAVTAFLPVPRPCPCQEHSSSLTRRPGPAPGGLGQRHFPRSPPGCAALGFLSITRVLLPSGSLCSGLGVRSSAVLQGEPPLPWARAPGLPRTSQPRPHLLCSRFLCSAARSAPGRPAGFGLCSPPSPPLSTVPGAWGAGLFVERKEE